MKRTNSNRTCCIQLNFTPEEYAKIEDQWTATTCRTRSNYLRNQIFEKPITINYRDQSIDEYMSEIIQLRVELNVLVNNCNQTEKKQDEPQQITSCIDSNFKVELQKEQLLVKVEEIENHIQKMAEKWLQ